MKKILSFISLAIVSLNTTAQNVGIGTGNPQAMLHVKDSSVLFSGVSSILPGVPSSPAPAQGTGVRMFWYPDKAAFRSGYAQGDEWNTENIGSYSTAVGYRSVASAHSSFAAGQFALADGYASIAMGGTPTASGMYSVALGENANALGNSSFAVGKFSVADAEGAISLGNSAYTSAVNSVAIGYQSSATGGNSTAIGDGAWAQGQTSVAIGVLARAQGDYSMALGSSVKTGFYGTAMGQSSEAMADYSTAIGYQTKATGMSGLALGSETEASGDFSTSMSIYSKSRAYASTAIGRYNDTTAGSSRNAWVATDPLFMIGNGTANNARRNAFTVFKNGNTDVNGYVRIGRAAGGSADNSGIETGWGISGKQADAGKIQYGGFGTTHTLNLVGGGTNATGADRIVKVWSEGGFTIRGNALPDADNLYSLGQSGARWSAVWAANGVIQTSDARLKTNITSLHYGLKELMQMQPVQYNWKINPDDKKEIGFLAQDIQKIIPEAVEAPANGDAMGMKYTELIPVLVKAIQEQQKEIEELKEKVKVLEKKN
ncbi:MAG: tail fiber domain-containing protein [Ferruginibacter sp.]